MADATASDPTHLDTSPWQPLLWWLGIPLAISHACLAPITTVRLVFLLNEGALAQNDRLFWIDVAQWLAFVGVLVHASLAALYLAWAPGQFAKRFLVCWLSVVAGAAFWFVGYLASPWIAAAWLDRQHSTDRLAQLQFWSDDLRNMAIATAALPTLLLGLQTPYWLARVVFGWKLRREHDPPTKSRQPLSIGDLMLVTTIVALGCALLQALSRWHAAADGENPIVVMFGILVAAIFGSVIIAVIALPLSWLFLTRFSLRHSWTIALGGSVLLTGVCVTVQWYVYNQITWQSFVAFGSLIFAYVIGVSLALSALRTNHWRLATRRVKT